MSERIQITPDNKSRTLE